MPPEPYWSSCSCMGAVDVSMPQAATHRSLSGLGYCLAGQLTAVPLYALPALSGRYVAGMGTT